MDSVRIQARFLVVSADEILTGGQIVIQRGRICEVTQSTSQRADVDLGSAVLLPGFVNCHTHLEFSHFTEPISAGANFPEWIGAVVRHRRLQASQLSESEQAQQLQTALVRGARECFASGTCWITDIVTPPWSAGTVPVREDFRGGLPSLRFAPSTSGPQRLSPEAWEEHLGPVSYPRILACPEIIGLDKARFEQSLQWARQIAKTDLSQVSPVLCGVGASPHAPYSLWSRGVEGLFDDPLMKRLVMATHLAESLDEREWTSAGTGAFRAAFEQLGVPSSHERLQIEAAIRLLQLAERGLVVHGNYLNAQEIEAIAATPALSVVWCPRTHEHFGHSPYPLESLLRRGINVVLGTDSRASNPDLNLWSELQAARRINSTLSASAGFAAITSGAAQAIGCQSEVGTLAVGKLAFVNVLATSRPLDARNLLEVLTSPSRGGPGGHTTDGVHIAPLAWTLAQEKKQCV